jgi:hypothetical protein
VPARFEVLEPAGQRCPGPIGVVDERERAGRAQQRGVRPAERQGSDVAEVHDRFQVAVGGVAAQDRQHVGRRVDAFDVVAERQPLQQGAAGAAAEFQCGAGDPIEDRAVDHVVGAGLVDRHPDVVSLRQHTVVGRVDRQAIAQAVEHAGRHGPFLLQDVGVALRIDHGDADRTCCTDADCGTDRPGRAHRHPAA